MKIKGASQEKLAKRLYSIKELVEEIGCTKWFWRTQIWERRLPSVRVGSKIFVDYQDIEFFISQNNILE